ncbi:MAG: pitrilysin family protein [Hyphomicrobium sp.]
MKIQIVKSSSGIEAWLVEAHAEPMMALRFAFDGGSSQDPPRKEGLAGFLAAMLKEGAGRSNAQEFQERMLDLSMRMGFGRSRDVFFGSLETLSQNRDQAAELLRLALAEPRFDAEAVERTRQRMLASIAQEARSPNDVAAAQWDAAAFPAHPYGRPGGGTQESVASISVDDLDSYRKRVLAKDTLRVVAVGDITPDDLRSLLDHVFADLPACAELFPVPKADPVAGARQMVIDMDVPQSVAVFGMGAIPREDPDYIAAFMLNHIVGGGGASKLMDEVRAKRGLAYGVSTTIATSRHISIIRGGVATRNDMMGESLNVIRAELQKMASGNISQTDLDNAKSYLIGSYPLQFDTNAKVASQLLGLRVTGFGPEYIETRSALIAAVTLDDLKRVAKRLLDTSNLIVTVVGRPMLQKAS